MHFHKLFAATLSGILLLPYPVTGTDGPASTLDELRETCRDLSSPSRVIEACTALLESPDARIQDRLDARFHRAFAYDDIGRYKDAIVDLDVVLELSPHDAEALRNRGVAWENLGVPERAAADWVREIKAQGPRAAVWWQSHIREHGSYYSGPIDGRLTIELEDALLACAEDPTC